MVETMSIIECVEERAKFDFEKVNQIVKELDSPRQCIITVNIAPSDKKNWIYERYIRFVRFKTPLSERNKHKFNKNHWRRQYYGSWQIHE